MERANLSRIFANFIVSRKKISLYLFLPSFLPFSSSFFSFDFNAMGPKRVISAKFSKIVRGSRQKIWTLFNGITEEEKRKCTIDFSKQGKESFFPRNVKKEVFQRRERWPQIVSSLYQFIGYFSTRVRLDFSKAWWRVCVNNKTAILEEYCINIIITLFTIDLHEKCLHRLR